MDGPPGANYNTRMSLSSGEGSKKGFPPEKATEIELISTDNGLNGTMRQTRVVVADITDVCL